MTDRFIVGYETSRHQVLRISRLVGATAWPSLREPFLTNNMLMKCRFPEQLGVLAENITEEILKKLLASPITCVIDSNTQD